MATQAKKAEKGLKNITSSQPVETVQKNVKPLQAFVTKFNNDQVMTFSGVLAYNLLVSLLPIVIAVIGILGLFITREQSTALVQRLAANLPGLTTTETGQLTKIADVATQRLQSSAGILLAIAIVLAIFAGSRLFVVIEQFLDFIYHVRPRPLIRQNLMAIGMFVLFIILIPIMSVASSGPALVVSVLGNIVPFLKNNPVLVWLGGIASALLVGFLLFEAIYFIVPNQKISFRHSWLGALIAAVLLEIFLVLFPFYITHFLNGYTGSIGFAVILLLFFYYFAVILLLGAEVNAFFDEHVQPLPNDLFTFVTTLAGRLNKDRPETESASHMNAKPTVNAANAQFAGSRERENQTGQKNTRKQQNTSSQALAQEHVKATAKAKEKGLKVPSQVVTALEVVAGSALAVIIELVRLRRHGK